MAQKKRSNADQIGERIAEFRKSKGYSQDYLAAVLHMSRSALNMRERGERSLLADEAVQMADYLGVSVDELLNGVRPENVSIKKATGLEGDAIEALRAFHDSQGPELSAALSSALSHKSVLTALAQYMSSGQTPADNTGYFCQADYSLEDGMVHSTMSPVFYHAVLGQNLLRTIDMASSGDYKEFSFETGRPEEIRGILEEEKKQDEKHRSV